MEVRAPCGVRDSREDEDGSNEGVVALSKKLNPAKAPVRPTWPIRSKSTRGSEAEAVRARKRRGHVLVGGNMMGVDEKRVEQGAECPGQPCCRRRVATVFGQASIKQPMAT